LSLLWLLFLNNRFNYKKRKSPKLILFLGILGFILLFLQISLGAWTSTNYASLSCPDFPFCQNNEWMTWKMKQAFTLFSPIGVNYAGGVLPEIVRQTIQMTHRLGALIVTLYLFMFSAFVMLKSKKIPDLMKTTHTMLGLLVLQVCIGISNIIFKLPLITAILHTLVAALLLLTLMTVIFNLTREKMSS
jgi:cytochrome c oxidase assembly protein subunit 15